MLAATPLLFAVQMILLPAYLWLFMGSEAASIMKAGPFVEAFLLLIVIPLLLAVWTQVLSNKTEMHSGGFMPQPGSRFR